MKTTNSIRLFAAMSLLFGVALFLHFVRIESWTVWAIALVLGMAGFIWSWIELYRKCRKRSHKIVIATLFLSFLFCTPIQSPAQEEGDSFGLCEAIVGGAILVGGAYATYKLYCTAKRLLGYPTNSPPPMPPHPPTNRPSSGSSFVGQLDSSDLGFTANVGNWTDWRGFPIIRYVEGTAVRYITETGTNEMLSSTDMIHWQPEPIFIRSWVSSASNSITITADAEGIPFATNWSEPSDGTLVTVFELSTPHAIPVRNYGRRFYRQQAQ